MTIEIPQKRSVIKASADTFWMPSTVAFGPGTPISPAGPEENIRQMDYMVGRNYQIVPRAAESYTITFDQMRSISKLYGVMRSIIEKCKDEIRGIEWDIQVREGFTGYDEEAKKEKRFWDHPDGDNTFDQWLGAIEEDRLVIDAATIFKNRNKGGELTCLDYVDGATMLVLVNDKGKVPRWPEPAYEQVIKGYPRTQWTKNAISYRPYNVNTTGVYGFSHVESIIMTVNIALRRDTLFLEYFKSGNMPYGLVPGPENWTPEQMIKWQMKFDDLLSGDLSQRSKLVMFPGAKEPTFIQPLQFDAEFDEWLARIVCARFGKSPQPFARQMNRATAQTAQETSTDVSLVPTLQYYKSWFDELIAERGKPYLEFVWTSGQLHFQKQDAEINDIMLKSGACTLDYVREQKGLAPYKDGMGKEPMVWTGSGPLLLKDVIAGKTAAAPAAPFAPAPAKPTIPPAEPAKDADGIPIVRFEDIGKPEEKPVSGIPAAEKLVDPEKPAVEEAIKAELDAWEKFALKRIGKNSRAFKATVIPAELVGVIDAGMKGAATPEAIKAAFAAAKIRLAVKGGSGSGNFNHAGRPGEVGGSEGGGGSREFNPGQKEAINIYTKAPSFASRVRQGDIPASAQKYVKNLDSAIASSPIDEDIEVYRGVGNGVFPEGDLIGTEFTDKSFVSTTYSRDMATEFRQRTAGTKGGTIMQISIPRGTNALDMERSGFGIRNEREVLLGRNSLFRITSDSHRGSVRIITAEVVHG